MILSDRDIVRRLYYATDDDQAIGIDPDPDPVQIQPASVDLRLGREFIVPDYDVVERERMSFKPGSFALGVTAERVSVPPDLVGHMTGRSTLGRKGVVVHATAGLVDPGWDGYLTLEIANLGSEDVTLEAGDRIAQIEFVRLTSPAADPYDGQYDGDSGPQPAGGL